MLEATDYKLENVNDIIINEITKKGVACVIPTKDRPQDLKECVKSYMNNCPIPTEIIIVDDSLDPIRAQDILEDQESWHKIQILTGNTMKGVGPARAYGVQYVLDKTDHQYIVNTEDDARIMLNSIERLLAVIYQEPTFGYVGTVGNYKAFWRDWESDEVRFYHNLGVLWAFNVEFIKQCGNFDVSLVLREDLEMCLRAWFNGYYVGAVEAPIKHKRSSSEYKAGDPPWMQANQQIQDKYGNFIKTTKNGRVMINKKVFTYPKIKYKLANNLRLLYRTDSESDTYNPVVDIKDL